MIEKAIVNFLGPDIAMGLGIFIFAMGLVVIAFLIGWIIKRLNL